MCEGLQWQARNFNRMQICDRFCEIKQLVEPVSKANEYYAH